MKKLIDDREVNKFLIYLVGSVLLLFIILIIAITVATISQFIIGGRDGHHSPEGAFWNSLRKSMEMYLADNNKYPEELNNLTNINSDNPKLINSLGRYTNVTNLLKSFENDEIKSIKITKNNFTITAKAKDKKYSLLTADASNVYWLK